MEERVLGSLQHLPMRKGPGRDFAARDDGTGTEFSLRLDEVEEIVGYRFKERGLLVEAYTHLSYGEGCPPYERLEYMGDSVLNMLITSDHFFSYPAMMEGPLTRLRSLNVDTEKLARAALKHNLHSYLRHNNPLLDSQVLEFKQGVLQYPLHSNGLIDAPEVLADIVESTVGAIFVDSCSMDVTWKVVKDLLQPMITPGTIQLHPVTRLHEACQKHGCKVRCVDLWSKSGEVEIYIDGEFAGRGKYEPKKEIAVNRAAHDAYNNFVRKLEEREITQKSNDKN